MRTLLFIVALTFQLVGFAQIPSISYSVPGLLYVGVSTPGYQVTNTGGAPTKILFATTLAGNETGGYQDGTGTVALFSYPVGLVEDPLTYDIYVADMDNHKIRKITQKTVVTTVAGGASGFSNGIGNAAKFTAPYFLKMDANRNIYVVEPANNAIRKVTPEGVVSTYAGGVAGNATGNLSTAQFNSPTSLVFDSQENLYVADNGNKCIRKITSGGAVSTFAGSGITGFLDGDAATARFNTIRGMCVDAADNVYVADYGNNAIRKITPAGYTSTLAGLGVINAGYVDGNSDVARFNGPYDVAFGKNGNLYVADNLNYCIRMVTMSGVVSTAIGTNSLGLVDGDVGVARLRYPRGIAIDHVGDLLIADTYNQRICKVINQKFRISPALPDGLTLDGETGTIAGTPTETKAQTTYTISSANDSGTATTTVTFAVVTTSVTATADVVSNSKLSVLDAGLKIRFEGSATVELYTSAGMLIEKNIYTNEYSKKLDKGLYLLRLSADGSKSMVYKIVIL